MNGYAVLIDGCQFVEINGRRVFGSKPAALQARDIWADSNPNDRLIVVELVAVSTAP